MKTNQWVIGVLGVLVGIGGTIGTQWAIENLPSASSGNSTNNYDYQGFEDEYALDSITWDEFSAIQYPEENPTPIADGIYDFNFEQIQRLEDQTYFLAYAKVETILGRDIRFTTFAHLTQDLNVIWDYDFIPSHDYIEALDSLDDFTFDITELAIIGNTAILGLKFENFDSYFDEATQTDTFVFIGDNFLPIGADENAEVYDFSVSLSINLDTYAFDVLAIEALSPVFDLSWEQFIVIGDDLLVHARVRSSDPSNNVEIFGAITDGEIQYYHFFFRYALDENDEIEIENLGYILTNLDFEMDWYDIQDFDGYMYEQLDNKVHVVFEFEYNESLDQYEYGEPLLVDFSNTFDLISADGRTEIENYFQNFELSDTTESIFLLYHALIDIRTLDVFHGEIVNWSYEITQNDVWVDLSYVYASEDDFAVLINEEVFNYNGEGDFAYRLIDASSTLIQYTDGDLVFEMTFSEDQVVLFTHLIRTNNHYIFVGRTNQLLAGDTTTNYEPSVMILLTSLEFIPLDTIIIDTEAPTYIDGILLEETTLTVGFWSVTNKEAFTSVLEEDGDIYIADITLILA
jgi:hypothetical protein